MGFKICDKMQKKIVIYLPVDLSLIKIFTKKTNYPRGCFNRIFYISVLNHY